jgi:catechol 2,3-dioxygenase-like lactoylglutathione lyase family enzyme
MDIETASVTFTTTHLLEVRRFYEQHWGAKTVFDCGWYVVLRLAGVETGPELCLMEPRDGATEFAGGVTLNLRVADADAAYARLTRAGLEPMIPLEDHPWGDRGFGILDPCGVVVYCYHEIEPASEFKPYFVESD